MTDREIMKLALEALSRSDYLGWQLNIPIIKALRQALEQPDHFARLVRIMGTFDLSTGHADNWNDLLDSLESELRDVLGYYRETFKVEQECNPHPDAPHGFNRDASHNYGRYVCDCEGWKPSDDDAAWATHLKEPMSEKRVHESDTNEPWDTTDMAHRAGGLSMEQEPVYAFRRKGLDDFCICDKRRYDELASKPDLFEVAVFYTAPPKREWVGLTDEERNNLWREVVGWGDPSHDDEDLMKAIEAKLKGKNHA